MRKDCAHTVLCKRARDGPAGASGAGGWSSKKDYAHLVLFESERETDPRERAEAVTRWWAAQQRERAEAVVGARKRTVRTQSFWKRASD